MSRWPMLNLGLLTEDQTALRSYTVALEDEVVDPTISSTTHTISISSKKLGSAVSVRRRTRIEPGDLVFSRLHTQNGAFAFSADYFHATNTFIPLKVREELVDRRYLFWALHKFVPTLSSVDTVGRETFKTDEILALRIPVPPSLAEQQRLARILDEADQLLELRSKGEERARDLIPALFDEMFGNPWLNVRGWETTTLGQLGKVVTGNTPPRTNPEYYGDFVEWIKTNNIDASRGTVGQASERLSEIGAIRGRLVPAGSVLITCIAGSIDRIGDAAIVDREVAINQQINAITPTKKVDAAFLLHLVGALKDVIRGHAAGVMTRIINKSSLEKIPAILPSNPQQVEFGLRVAEIRKLQDVQETSRKRIEDLSCSLLDGVFKGEL